ncbi:MAG: site-2 protease family protein [Polyangiaceae bacterium]|nr:site-2 protease family protein [Polyangiaceae bacterium]
MNVRLLGFDIEITMGFWLTAVLIGFTQAMQNPMYIVMWGLILLVSVLVHELGHAIAFRTFGVSSSIRLHFLGGATFPNVVLPLTRPKNVIVSLAGPFAGFLLAGVVWGVRELVPIQHPGLAQTLRIMLWANIGWSIINLMPVLPLDGGHVVEHALGPRRYRITLGVSAVVGTVIAILCLMSRNFIGLYIFGSAAVQSFIALRETGAAVRASKEASEPARAAGEPLAPETARALSAARDALDNGQPERAIEMAKGVLEGRERNGARPQARALPEALSILGWAHLALGQTAEAVEVTSRLTRMAHADPALVANVAAARGDDEGARRLLEAARAAGDERKEVFGPLIQILLREGEPARAAALALDCAESISAEDLRTLASMVTAEGAHHWAGRLYEAIFKRERTADDAFEAARAFARATDPAKAIELMRRAVQAGFTDAKRVWADEALVGIDELEHVLPRSS